MTQITTAKIEQIKMIEQWNSTKFHGNRKMVGLLTVEEFTNIVSKKVQRSLTNYTGIFETESEKTMRRLKDSLSKIGSPYQKVLIEGNTNIYYASPIYGHSDYNKSIAFPKNKKTLRLLHLFNSIINKIAS